ncbi:MAG: tyrosine-protein phosphatase, partial [Oscillospiraceae bacterium]
DCDLGTFTREITVKDPLAGGRCYFHIMTGARYSVAATREIELEGLNNFRELGGYNTDDGSAFVKHGLLMRSDRLYLVGEGGVGFLRALGLKTVLDFRVPVEAEKRRDPDISGVEFINLTPIDPDNYVFKFSLDETISGGRDKLISVSNRLIAEYRELPFKKKTYGRMFELLLDNHAPMLFHCTAGKDRTGVAAVLILLALGVSRETAIYDYMLTATVRAQEIERMKREYSSYITDAEIDHAMTTFFSVHRESIEGSLAAIDEAYPSGIEDFFEKEMQLSEAKRAQLRSMYLTKHIERNV